ncbi:MAG: hypothetical protein G01um101493_103, partial [Microgenomates group bacterium Gr01-1014_93]
MERHLVESTPYLAIGAIKKDVRRFRAKEANINGIINIGYGRTELVCRCDGYRNSFY